MGSEEAALLAAVLDDYDDDLPRLALADWWEGDGQDERAEFVRVQCAVAQLEDPSPPGVTADTPFPASRLAALRRREGELLPAVRELVCGPLCGGGVGSGMFHFRRGFVAAVECSAAGWLRDGDAITAAQPVEEVTLTAPPDLPRARGRSVAWYTEAFSKRWPRVRHWHLPFVRIEPSRTHGAPWQAVPLDSWQWG